VVLSLVDQPVGQPVHLYQLCHHRLYLLDGKALQSNA